MKTASSISSYWMEEKNLHRNRGWFPKYQSRSWWITEYKNLELWINDLLQKLEWSMNRDNIQVDYKEKLEDLQKQNIINDSFLFPI